MPSTATLTTLRDRVEAFLIDSSNAVWTTGTLDEALRLAIHEYSRRRPQRAVGTLTLAAAGREVALSSLTGLLGVDRVWFPYTSADPEYPPEWITFEVWDQGGGSLTLFLNVKAGPAVGDVARLYYRKLHTLNGLDGAGSTTFAAEDESLLVLGAAGYAASAELLNKAGSIRIDQKEFETLRDWGAARLAEFREDLRRPARAGLTI